MFFSTDGKFKDCSEIRDVLGSGYVKGVYRITTDFHDPQGTEVFCDPEGWTVIQSRGQFENPVDYFYKNWDEYVKGFGEPGLGSKIKQIKKNSQKSN